MTCPPPRFSPHILMAGCGSIGQGLLPLLLSTRFADPSQITVMTADEKGRHVAARYGIRYLVEPLTPENHESLLSTYLRAGDLLLNLSVNVSSQALIRWCRTHDVLYLDTCVEPWAGGYISSDAASIETTNASLRQKALELHKPGAATAVIAHGMNPGLVSHLLKEALLALAGRKGVAVAPAWGRLAQTLGVKVVHVVERDTQDNDQPLARGEFANTWSAEGLYSEAWLQRAELGWGTHEHTMPTGAQLLPGGRALRLIDAGAKVRLRSWLPSTGEQTGMLLTHHEVISIARLLETGDYQPSVCYVYTPCPKAQKSLLQLQAGHAVSKFCVLNGDAAQGFDEVGVLLVHDTGSLWHGSTLSCDEARSLAPYNSATSLQVVAGILGALAWMLDHPRAGVVEAEAMDSAQVLAVARPYLGLISTVETDWQPGAPLTFDKFRNEKDFLYEAIS